MVANRSKVVIGIMILSALLSAMLMNSRNVEAVMPPASKEVEIEVLFSPKGGVTERIIQEIKGAEDRVLIQMYLFTSKQISDALVAAKKRGVKVEVIIDKSQEKQKFGRLPILRRDGVKVFIDGEHATANSKVMLIDDSTVITGSFNYTKAAEEKNSENVLFIRGDEELFEKYLENYENHREHSRKYGGS